MPEMTALQAAGLWSGLLILLMVGLAFRVVANRRRTGCSSATAGCSR